MRVIPAAALPDLGLVGSPTDAVQQPRIAGRMIRDARSDDLAGLQIGDLHSPEASDIVDSVVARAVDCIGSEDARVGPDARYRVAARVDQVQIMAAPVTCLRLLENRPGERVLSVVRSIGEMHLSDDVTGVRIDDVDVVGRPAFPGRYEEQLSVGADSQPIDTGDDRSTPENRVIIDV